MNRMFMHGWQGCGQARSTGQFHSLWVANGDFQAVEPAGTSNTDGSTGSILLEIRVTVPFCRWDKLSVFTTMPGSRLNSGCALVRTIRVEVVHFGQFGFDQDRSSGKFLATHNVSVQAPLPGPGVDFRVIAAHLLRFAGAGRPSRRPALVGGIGAFPRFSASACRCSSAPEWFWNVLARCIRVVESRVFRSKMKLMPSSLRSMRILSPWILVIRSWVWWPSPAFCSSVRSARAAMSGQTTTRSVQKCLFTNLFTVLSFYS